MQGMSGNKICYLEVNLCLHSPLLRKTLVAKNKLVIVLELFCAKNNKHLCGEPDRCRQ